MIASIEKEVGQSEPPTPSPVAVVDIGNSSIAIGLWSGGKVTRRVDLEQDRTEQVVRTLKSYTADGRDGLPPVVVVASVVPETLGGICKCVLNEMDLEALVVGRQIPLPMDVSVASPEAVGVDRICTAAAAFDRKKEACIVADLGTAITVDVVDSNGAFMGGAILPGLQMQARALHESTALLPEVTPERPNNIVGQDTGDAIRGGIYYGTAGAIRSLVEAYAGHIGRWPPVVATGGDALLIAGACDIFESIVPDLCLMGIGLAYNKWLSGGVTL